MEYHRRLVLEGEEADVREGIRAWYLGERYEVRSDTGERLVLHREGTLLQALASRVEHLPTTVSIRVGSLPPSGGAAARTLVTISYAVTARLRLVTRIDYLFFQLEVDGIAPYLATGARTSPAARLAPIRTPVTSAVVVNLAISTLLVATVGGAAGFNPFVTVAAAVVIALVNLVSILGFADILVEGMEGLQEEATSG